VLEPWPTNDSSGNNISSDLSLLTGSLSQPADPQSQNTQLAPPPPPSLTYRQFIGVAGDVIAGDVGVRAFLQSLNSSGHGNTTPLVLPYRGVVLQRPSLPRYGGNSANASSTSETYYPSSIGSFRRSHSIRHNEEMVPVYTSSASHAATDFMNMNNIFIFPMGLISRGVVASTSEGTSVGIYHIRETTLQNNARNVSDEMEGSSRDAARRQRLRISPYASAVFSVRVDYDESRLRVSSPSNIVFEVVHPGLTLLDAIASDQEDWWGGRQRPRGVSGTVWIESVGVFLETLERLFGQRVESGGQPSASSRGRLSGRAQILNLSRDGQVSSSNTTRSNMSRALFGSSSSAAGRQPQRSTGSTNAAASSPWGPRRIFNHHWTEGTNNARRVLSLAVNAATTEILGGSSSMDNEGSGHHQRPVESRIERVLNERSTENHPPASGEDRQALMRYRRMEQLQRRISAYHYRHRFWQPQTQNNQPEEPAPFQGLVQRCMDASYAAVVLHERCNDAAASINVL
jgi:hypothetical protein